MWRVVAEEWETAKVVGTKDFPTEEEALKYALDSQNKFEGKYFMYLEEVK